MRTLLCGKEGESGIDFTYMFTSIICAHYPKSAKIQLSHQRFFALLGSVHAKAACKTLVNFTPGGLGNGQILSEQKLSEVGYAYLH